jgi:hypothetical protein
MPSTRILAAAALAAGAAFLAAPAASADMTIKDPNPPQYKLELEPKFNITPNGFFNYGGTGFGPGVRLSIPIMSPGFVKTINDSIAISFGADLIRYEGYTYFEGCGRGGPCVNYNAGGFWSLYLPVAMQWNFWLSDRWSVFAEPGFAFRHAFFDTTYCDSNRFGNSCTSSNDFYLALYAGGRFAITDTLALTMRLGHPTLLSVGLSIFF